MDNVMLGAILGGEMSWSCFSRRKNDAVWVRILAAPWSTQATHHLYAPGCYRRIFIRISLGKPSGAAHLTSSIDWLQFASVYLVIQVGVYS